MYVHVLEGRICKSEQQCFAELVVGFKLCKHAVIFENPDGSNET